MEEAKTGSRSFHCADDNRPEQVNDFITSISEYEAT